jgi:hypothetical protein
MNRRMWKLGLVPAVFTLLCLSGPVVATDQVPFKGTFAGPLVSVLTPPCTLSATIGGGGQATHLGNYTWASTHTVNLCTTPFTVSGGSVTLTAANGDQLYGDYAGTSHFVDATILAFEITITITDGTGRFANASGSIEVTGLVDTVADVSTATMEGSISSVGSNKK